MINNKRYTNNQIVNLSNPYEYIEFSIFNRHNVKSEYFKIYIIC
jgi:hypothetical protein